MHTAFDIDDDMFAAVKELARRESRTVSAVVSALWRQSLTGRSDARRPSRVVRGCRIRSHAFWPESFSLLEDGRLNLDRVLSPRHVTDVHLLALAVVQGARW